MAYDFHDLVVVLKELQREIKRIRQIEEQRLDVEKMSHDIPTFEPDTADEEVVRNEERY